MRRDLHWRLAGATGLLLAAAGRAEVVCAGCHARETASYLASPMGNSLGPPVPVPGGRAAHQRSGSTIEIQQRGGKMFHLLLERGLSAEYEIAYQIGAGNFAHSYLVRINGYWFESPATWFRSSGWDVSPGYAQAPAIDFDRPITETCLFCHAGNARFAGSDGRRPAGSLLTAISCERCHGPSEDHVRQPSARNTVNPEKLSRRARDSVCEQCHLEGEVRVLNPGKTWQDFHPGDDLERTMAVYVTNQDGHEVKAVSQVEQLAQSRCAARSGGRLWCGSCHKPHGQAADRQREIRDVCRSCHAAVSQAAHAMNQEDCVSCHMPRQPTEYAHVAVTDHRIVRRAGAVETQGSGRQTLAAWVEPPAEFRQRDLALAELTAGMRRGSRTVVRAGLDIMKSLPNAQCWDDTALLAAACDADGVASCRAAAEVQPASADRAMALGMELARSGDLREAERELRRAIELDPSLKHAYVELWTLYSRERKTQEMAETAGLYLGWNPRNIMFRILQSMLAVEPLLDLPWLLPPL